MKKKRLNKKLLFAVAALCVICIITSFWLLDETAAQSINLIAVFVIAALVLVLNVEKDGMRELVLLAAPVLSNMLGFMENAPLSDKICRVYNTALEFVITHSDYRTDFRLGKHTCLVITFWLVFAILYILLYVIKGNKKAASETCDSDFQEKNYSEKCQMFCKTLRQRIESINRKMDWNENLFTPLDAEVEACVNGKRKKKFDDLLKCLKKTRRENTVFRVLGDPGAGKSVSLRKLCLDLLDEAKSSELVPVYVDLKKWSKNWTLGDLPGRKDLIEFIQEVLYEDGDILTDEFLKCYFDKMLEHGRWYFVFDSFDELPCLMGKENCQELIDHISTLLYDFMTSPGQKGGVIASRLFRAPSDSEKAGVTLHIREFSDLKIKTMLKKYLNSATEVVNKLFKEREDLVVLCRNPFYLTLLINYVRENGIVFPANQMELYSSFVDNRLTRCAGKLEEEGITIHEIDTVAQTLAVYMQRSANFGLECPTAQLSAENDGINWSKVLKLLKYAKICRLGGSSETVSFVHRRFQEYFLVKNIMQTHSGIDQAQYDGIVTNSGFRDALVLYCEIADENSAEDIAEYCWSVVSANIEQRNSILNEGCTALANTLYFMSEAFRNRRSALSGFLASFQQLVKASLDSHTDPIIQHALATSMVLFDENHLQDMVLKVFRLNNRWISDVVMQNSRMIKKLDGHIETEMGKHLRKLDRNTFMLRFRDTNFSLSLDQKFLYLRLINIVRYVYELFMMIAPLVSVLVWFLYSSYQFTDLNMSEVGFFAAINAFTKAYGQTDLIFGYALVVLVFFTDVQKSERDRDLKDTIFKWVRWAMFFLGCSVLPVTSNYYAYPFLIISFTAMGLMILLPFIHDIYYIIKEKKLKDTLADWVEDTRAILLVIGMLLLATVPVIAIAIILYRLWGQVFSYIVCGISVFTGLIIGITELVKWIKDQRWVSHQPVLKKITRKELAQNLAYLSYEKSRCAYIDFLLQNKTCLTGHWPDDKRPRAKSDELTMKLSKLDCMELTNFRCRF